MKRKNAPCSGILSLCILLTVIILFATGSGSPVHATVIAEKTPDDVFIQVSLLARSVKVLRVKNNITTPWPKVAVNTEYEPRHVLQKALEVLGKINQFRINIQKTGEIAVPRFPGRDITPNEVYNAVIRLRRELALLLPEAGMPKGNESLPFDQITAGSKTPGDVYAALAEVSLALDETLGLRGFTPSDVYLQSLRVLDLVKFLRKSQNLPMDVAKPELSSGKLPNHALQASYLLFARIQLAEKNLWMKPITVPELPRRVVTPVDVFDATNVALAELQRIKFRLGLERYFKAPTLNKGKKPDDVIQNLQWAAQLLPDFTLTRPLRQFNRDALKKTPNHVYSVTDHILKRLSEYRRLKGIQAPPRKAQMIYGLKPQHVYEKALEILEKIDTIRVNQHLGPIAVQHFPLRLITPSEVFDLTLRLDEELDILFRQEELGSELWLTATRVNEYDDKNPSDVFFNMQRISLMLDTILGSEGFTPSHVFKEAVSVENNIEIIARALGTPVSNGGQQNSLLLHGMAPRDVYLKARQVMQLVLEAKKRGGMFGVRDISIPPSEPVTPNDVFNQVRIIDAELTELKVFLGISEEVDRPAFLAGKTPAHVFQVLERAEHKLLIVLHGYDPLPPADFRP